MDDLEIPRYVHKWYHPLWRPDMSQKTFNNLSRILMSGILFVEDSITVETELGLRNGTKLTFSFESVLPTFTKMEKIAATVSVAVCVAAVPLVTPIASRRNIFRVCCYAGATLIPLTLRLFPPATLPTLLDEITHYSLLSRRHITSKILFPIESVSSVLVAQQKYMCLMIKLANASVLEAFPWIEGPRGGDQWEETPEVKRVLEGNDLSKIHHILLVTQSTFLKNLALAHFPPTKYSSQFSRSNNNRVYWLHTKLIPAVTHYYQYSSAMLDNANKYYKDMMRKKDSKLSLPKFLNSNRDSWQYAQVHGSVYAIGADLRLALGKCNDLDSFLEAGWTANSKFSPEILHEDMVKLRDYLLKCFGSMEAAFVQLQKIRSADMKLLEAAVQKLPLPSVQEEDCDSSAGSVVVINEDTPVEIQDQVYYFEKTEEEKEILPRKVTGVDLVTGPGPKEINASNIVINELRVKLAKKEEEMRKRETDALEKTMPELKGKIPEFPRQINVDDKPQEQVEEDLIRIAKFYNISTNGDVGSAEKKVSPRVENGQKKPTNGHDTLKQDVEHFLQSEQHVNGNRAPANGQQNGDKKELLNIPDQSNNGGFLSDEYYGSSSDDDVNEMVQMMPSPSLLQDVRKNRVTRKKRHPPSRSGSLRLKEGHKNGDAAKEDVADESLKPVEYSFGAGLAMASLMQIKDKASCRPVLGEEETFDGEGEVSCDSGNEY